MHPIAGKLIEWYGVNRRDLPWRKTQDPYRIWLSEIILQQTRVEQGLPYYHRFEEDFPDVSALALADEQKVLKAWQGLGYYSRARNLHKTAKIIHEKFNGVFPNDYDSIRELPGIGDYTSAAIASFAFQLPHAVVDGNVYRFLSRIFGIDAPIDSTAGKRLFQKTASELIEGAPPDRFNQALMEFGALHCTPARPNCGNCVFSESCIALKTGTVSSLPVKSKKQKVRDRYFNYLVVRKSDEFFIKRRGDKDIWKNLWEFPLIESDEKKNEEWVLKEAAALFDTKAAVYRPAVDNRVHQLSHQRLHATFHEFLIDTKTVLPPDWEKVDQDSVSGFPVPRLIDLFLKEFSAD